MNKYKVTADGTILEGQTVRQEKIIKTDEGRWILQDARGQRKVDVTDHFYTDHLDGFLEDYLPADRFEEWFNRNWTSMSDMGTYAGIKQICRAAWIAGQAV